MDVIVCSLRTTSEHAHAAVTSENARASVNGMLLCGHDVRGVSPGHGIFQGSMVKDWLLGWYM